jgi:hypothetical protein
LVQTASSAYECASGTCNGWATAADTITPSGCIPNTSDCTGWNVSSTYSGIFTSSDCGASCTVDTAGAAMVLSSSGLLYGNTAFDGLTPSVVVAQGDSLALTITFAVS